MYFLYNSVINIYASEKMKNVWYILKFKEFLKSYSEFLCFTFNYSFKEAILIQLVHFICWKVMKVLYFLTVSEKVAFNFAKCILFHIVSCFMHFCFIVLLMHFHNSWVLEVCNLVAILKTLFTVWLFEYVG